MHGCIALAPCGGEVLANVTLVDLVNWGMFFYDLLQPVRRMTLYFVMECGQSCNRLVCKFTFPPRKKDQMEFIFTNFLI